MLKIYTAIRINHETIGLSTKRTQSAPSKHFAHYKFEKKKPTFTNSTTDKIRYDGREDRAKITHCSTIIAQH